MIPFPIFKSVKYGLNKRITPSIVSILFPTGEKIQTKLIDPGLLLLKGKGIWF